METIYVQQNLELNIVKVIEKIRQEGLRGIDESEYSYPIEELGKEKMFIKNYSEYMKLIQILDTIINMYSHLELSNDGKRFISKILKNKLEEEIEFMQNTGMDSLNRNFISQYSCLIKCYNSLLGILRRF